MIPIVGKNTEGGGVNQCLELNNLFLFFLLKPYVTVLHPTCMSRYLIMSLLRALHQISIKHEQK